MRRFWNRNKPVVIAAFVLGLGMNTLFAFLPNITANLPWWIDYVIVILSFSVVILGFILLFRSLDRHNTNIELADALVEPRNIGPVEGFQVKEGVTAMFAVALFQNKPRKDYQKIEVRVAATIKFQDQKGNTLFNTMQGRWSNSLERSRGGLPAAAQRCILSPDEIPEPLLIALKHQDEDFAYGLNWDNDAIDTIHWTDPRKQIPKGTHRVTIRLTGIDVDSDREYYLELTNHGKGADITLKKLPTQTLVVHKEDSQKQ